MVKNKNIQNKGGANKIKSSLKEKILKFLIENKEPLSILQIADKLNTDYKNTFQAINNLSEIIIKNKKGNSNFISIKLSPIPALYSVESKRTKEFLEKNKQIKLIQEDIKSLNYPFFIVLVFGSFVKKINTSKSDLDLCIISDNKDKTKELISKISLLPLPIEIQEFTAEEFESMIKQKQANVANEIIKNNIILYGIENYYNLVSKWMKKE